MYKNKGVSSKKSLHPKSTDASRAWQKLDTLSFTCRRLLSSSLIIRFLHKLHDIFWFGGLEKSSFCSSQIMLYIEGLLRGQTMWYNMYKIFKTVHRKLEIHLFFWGQIVFHCYENANLEINSFFGAGPWLGICGNSGTKRRGFTLEYNTDFIQANLEYVDLGQSSHESKFFVEIDHLLEIEAVLSICSVWILLSLQVSGKTWKLEVKRNRANMYRKALSDCKHFSRLA